MVKYSIKPKEKLRVDGGVINSFVDDDDDSLDLPTVNSFSAEWSKFHLFTEGEIEEIGREYFDIVDFQGLSSRSVALDIGCGTGRWTRYVSRHFGFVEAIDPSSAVIQAYHNLRDLDNVRISKASVGKLPFPPRSFDFVFSLGVLHHVPNTEDAVSNAITMVKPGGSFLIYLYYKLENRAWLYRFIFKLSTYMRLVISGLPRRIKHFVCDCIAIGVYYPLASISGVLQKIKPFQRIGASMPLAYYSNKSFNVMRNDALDRFGTPLEKRFTKGEIERMLKNNGLIDIVFAENPPYWHVVGKKA